MMLVEDEPRRQWDVRVPKLQQLAMAALPPGAMDLVPEHVMDHFRDQVDANAVYFAPVPLAVPEDDTEVLTQWQYVTVHQAMNSRYKWHMVWKQGLRIYEIHRGRPHKEYTSGNYSLSWGYLQ